MRSLLCLMIVLMVAVMAASCVEQEPGEVSVRSTLNGKPFGCNIQVFNDKNRQIQEVAGDNQGVTYITALKPGKYVLKFTDNQRNPYPAVWPVTVRSADSVVLDVELNEPGPSGTATENPE